MFWKFGLSSKPATKYEEKPESLIRIFPDGEMKIKFRRQVGAEVDRQGSIFEELMSIELENEAQKKNGGIRKPKVVFLSGIKMWFIGSTNNVNWSKSNECQLWFRKSGC